ncbi:GNAT family N-acetyltransferase [Rhodospirillum rubrum]|uniref:GCN5-related N-acetyltransferase n=1 Tax=Rhodospirillum rubrum (strain ATCC 11170 / ATH 1.1.1 / DSM 467 / LMG 4362 / NCIMB 8255 / S1) TaxID=269796 RepID=Q2RTI4_RHORT|nr:GNAT family N-acetyltransferase [Rhodospirillum rubrum]ABC22561.1 GCN5-related N-acetyltransferase [Rhodospirillum rubrum ATCC 11170]AEO48279.1 GCN5-related N-acetyltransferase [Rhodospirillum rubrum F11]MBK5954150.1 N-acetyltransferase [Rhodospirillum rubrum]QXG82188.1 GNAT family N-acetyltransferase [Rhodospirillum rubrum]HAP98798.1 N-acetyltransferase [Rhodospirillum rubrum]
MNEVITVRDAAESDAPSIARLFVQAGEGLYEFLLGGLIPDMESWQMVSHLVEAGDSPIGWPECRVAVMEDTVVGMVNAFPVERLDELSLDLIPADRTNHLAPLFALRDAGSMLINAMAVSPTQRGAGIGRKLVGEALGMAGAEGRKRVSLQVWSTNTRAIALYEDFGFQVTGEITLPFTPRLSARRTLLMAREI